VQVSVAAALERVGAVATALPLALAAAARAHQLNMHSVKVRAALHRVRLVRGEGRGVST
jgi:hypothetical protein